MNKEKLGHSLLRHPTVCCKTTDSLEDGFEKLLHLGFTEIEAGELFSSEFSVTTTSYKVLKEKFDIPKKYNCEESVIKEMILGAPVYLTLSAKSLDKKFAVYDYYNLLDFVLENPRKLVQPSDLTEARASYLKTYHVLSDRAYCQMVFTSKKFFEKRFGVASEDILTLKKKG